MPRMFTNLFPSSLLVYAFTGLFSVKALWREIRIITIMAASIDSDSFTSAKETDNLHHMPCKIDYDGPAKVEQFFKCGVRKCDDGLHATFRGRPLRGEVKKVPEGYIGVVLKEPHKVYNEEDDRQIKVTHKFKEYTHWNLDNPASDNDKIIAATQWLEIAKAIHDPVKTQ